MNRIQQILLVSIIGIFIITTFVISLLSENINLTLNDSFVRLRYSLFGKQPQSNQLMVYNLTDSDLSKKPLMPLLSHFIQGLNRGKAKTVLFDIILRNPGNPIESGAMLEAVETGGNIFLPAVVDLRQLSKSSANPNLLKRPFFDEEYLDVNSITWAVKPFPALIKAAKGIGAIVQQPSYSGIIRKINLVYPYKDNFLPSLILSALIHYLDANYSDIAIKLGEAISFKGYLNGEERKFKIPIDSQGAMIINYAGPWDDSLRSYSINQLPENSKILYNLFNNSIVLLGDNTTAAKDWSQGIFGKTIYPNSGSMSNALNTVLTERFLHHSHFLFYFFLPLLIGFLVHFLFTQQIVPFIITNTVMFIGLPVYQFMLFMNGFIPNHLLVLLVIPVQLFLFILYKLNNGPSHIKTEKDIQFSTERLQWFLNNRLNFTEKQIEVVLPLLDGKQYKEIANLLNISMTSTRARIHKLYQKMGVNNKIEFSNWIRELMAEEDVVEK